jgi:hypothetical protein
VNQLHSFFRFQGFSSSVLMIEDYNRNRFNRRF